MTPALKQYLTDWLHWAENGAPDGNPFRRVAGLCFHARGVLSDELELLLRFDFGEEWIYPFGGEDDFDSRLRTCTQHENPARLAWVRSKVGAA